MIFIQVYVELPFFFFVSTRRAGHLVYYVLRVLTQHIPEIEVERVYLKHVKVFRRSILKITMRIIFMQSSFKNFLAVP